MGVHVVVFVLSCLVVWSLGLCAATPTPKHKVVLNVRAPHELCGGQPCNRVTHYCDQVIQSCSSCEDDCHPSRITGDEQAIQECQKICDWYYYIKSLNEKKEVVPVGESTQTKDDDNVTVHKYDVTVIVVLIVCFSVIVIVILTMFACYIKRQSTRPLVVTQETRETTKRNIYKPYNIESTPPSLVGPKNQSSNETSLKLLTDSDSSSLEVRTGQQESIQQSLISSRSAVVCNSARGPSSQPRSGKLYNKQVLRNNASLPQSQDDSSIQPLVKSLQ